MNFTFQVETSLMRTVIYCNGWPVAAHFARADAGRGPASAMARTKTGDPGHGRLLLSAGVHLNAPKNTYGHSCY